MEILRSCVEMIVPTTICCNTPADTEHWVQRVMADFSRWFGGASAREEEGCYMSEEKGLVFEKTRHISSYCTEAALREHIADVYALAREMCAALLQECVSLIVNGRMYYV